jgi:hypothetical protein
MTYRKLIAPALLVSLSLAGVVAIAEPAKEAKEAQPAAASASGAPEMKLPPGWTEEDMKACMIAGTPGKMHERLAKDVGTWAGKSTMWMPGVSEPTKSDCTMTISPLMDGRYFKGEMNGEMPGMGPYNGMGIMGFDNVSQKFVANWLDNHSTGIMNGTGELSPDGKSINWTYEHNCPITKKATVMRQVETNEGDGKKTLEMFGSDPKTGKEFKMMRIELSRK